MANSSEAAVLVGVDYVGDGSGGRTMSETNTLRVVFQNFERMQENPGGFVESSVMKCHGHKWTLRMFPRGNPLSPRMTSDQVSFTIQCQVSEGERGEEEGGSVTAHITVRFPTSTITNDSKTLRNQVFKESENTWICWYDIVDRNSVIHRNDGYLVDGNLTVEVDIQVALDKPPTWTPTGTLSTDMLKILESADAENSDVVFEIGVEKTMQKKELFYAHRCILSERSPALSALIEDHEDNTLIPIEDVDPEIFQKLLRFVYGGEFRSKDSLGDSNNNTRKLINAANRFGCTGLKLAAEAELVTVGITTENAAELILFADGTNCALLMEAATDYFVAHPDAVMRSDGFSKIQESAYIMKELMAAACVGNKKYPATSDPQVIDNERMRVVTLRQKLDDKGLDVDGSKKMLIARLEEQNDSDSDSEDVVS